MDIFNKKKVERLERRIDELEIELDIYRTKEIEENSGKHKAGAWCFGCEHLTIDSSSGCSKHVCSLDYYCEDKKERY